MPRACRSRPWPQAPSPPPPLPPPPRPPPRRWLLPLQPALPFRTAHLPWPGAPAVAARGLVGDYRFDGREHRLNIGAVELAQGRYSARATLPAQAPMALDVT